MPAPALPPQTTPHHPPLRERPIHPLPTTAPKAAKPAWSDRHPVWAGILCVMVAIVAFAVATFAWILGEEKFGFMTGFLTVVFLCYVVADWRKTFRMHEKAKS
ncbi:MAG: hypothetical protein ABI197_12380 [Granulicella sp.]